MTEQLTPGIRLALVDPHDRIIKAWDTVEIGKRAIAEAAAEQATGRLTRTLRPKRAAKIGQRVQGALAGALSDCFSDLAKL